MMGDGEARRRTQVARRENAIRGLLRAGYEIVATDGLDGLTLALAGEKAGFSRALPTHYFRSRGEFILAIGKEAAQAHRQWMGFMFRPPGGLPTILSSIANYLGPPSKLAGEARLLSRFRQEAALSPALHAIEGAMFDAEVSAMATLLRDAQLRREVVSHVDPLTEAHTLLALLEGASLRIAASTRSYPREAVQARILAITQGAIGS